MNIGDNLHISAVESNLLASVAYLLADIARNLLKVNLLGGDVCLTKKDNLKIRR